MLLPDADLLDMWSSIVLGSEHVERAGVRIGNLESGVHRQYSGTAGRVETEALVRGLPASMLTLHG